MKFSPFFAINQSFLDPKTTSKGEPYGPWRYKQIVQELYLISKNCNTSYTDLLDITITEKGYLLQFIADEIERSNEAMEKQKQELAAKKRGSRTR